MLIQFKVGNYLSFKNVVSFSMEAYNPIKEHENTLINLNKDSNKINLLKSCVLYGANASGKSNLISSILFMKDFIRNSSYSNINLEFFKYQKFQFSSISDNANSLFEIEFIADKHRFRYGFEINENAIQSEWLFFIKDNLSSKETKLFTRELQEISYNNRLFKEAKSIDKRTRNNALFLSTVAQWNGIEDSLANCIINWFTENLNIISLNSLVDPYYSIYKYQNDEHIKKQILSFMKNMDTGIENIEIEQITEKHDSNNDPGANNKFINLVSSIFLENTIKDNIKITNTFVNSMHSKFDENFNFLEYKKFNFNFESSGTKKLFALLGPILDCLNKSKILIIDEMDTSLHTLLLFSVIKLFHSSDNVSSQLIFSTHNTNILNKEIYRRDQIWFTEKDKFGSTDLYSLLEYKVNQATVRNDASYSKDYLLGKYGAIPTIKNMQVF